MLRRAIYLGDDEEGNRRIQNETYIYETEEAADEAIMEPAKGQPVWDGSVITKQRAENHKRRLKLSETRKYDAAPVIIDGNINAEGAPIDRQAENNR